MDALLAEPRWPQAARELISGCVDLPSDDDGVALLESVCLGLGDELYPAFLRLLCEVGRYGDHDARAAVARGKRLVCYDGAGGGAAKLAFVLTLMGYDDVAVYDGSWAECGDRLDLPVER